MTEMDTSANRSLEDAAQFVTFLGNQIGRSLADQAQYPLTEHTTVGDLELDSLEIIQVLVTLEMISPGLDLGVDSISEALEIELRGVVDAVFGVGNPLPSFVAA